jgi:hypothetical protein
LHRLYWLCRDRLFHFGRCRRRGLWRRWSRWRWHCNLGFGRFFFEFRFRFRFGFQLDARRFRFHGDRLGSNGDLFFFRNIYGDNVVFVCRRSPARFRSKHTEFPAQPVRQAVFNRIRM